jgi:xanthine dehydrogenase YagT iron-sulfur-binding subunit
VLVDGVPRYSCLTLAVEAEGRQVTTVEGLLDGETLGPVAQAFAEEDAFQCGFCTPGQVVAAEGLLRRIPEPTMDEVRLGMSGNLCRCGAYAHIFRAVRKAAERRRAGGGR